jgi:hypothetical protein
LASLIRFVWWVLLLSGSGPGTTVPDALTWALNRVAVMLYTVMLSLFACRWVDAVHSSLSSSSNVLNTLFKWIVGLICSAILVYAIVMSVVIRLVPQYVFDASLLLMSSFQLALSCCMVVYAVTAIVLQKRTGNKNASLLCNCMILLISMMLLVCCSSMRIVAVANVTFSTLASFTLHFTVPDAVVSAVVLLTLLFSIFQLHVKKIQSEIESKPLGVPLRYEV